MPEAKPAQTEKVGYRLPADLKYRIEVRAVEERMTPRDLIVKACHRYLDDQGEPKPAPARSA